MKLRALLRSRFARSRDGLAAVEFALLLPVMITIFFGIVETSLALICRTNVVNVASTISDLVAQKGTMTDSDITNVLNAANTILYPYPTNTAKIVISSLIDTGTPTSGKVVWSDAQNGTARSAGTIVSVPSGLISSGGSVVLTEITYTYVSPTTQLITGPINMTSQFYSKPRRVAQILRAH